MAINTNGSVLRPPRSAPSNATSTGEATTGVYRDHHALPSTYDFFGSSDDLAEVSADQFRAITIDDPEQDTTEYLLWAANSSSLARLEDPSWTAIALSPSETATIPPGSSPVYSNLTSTIAFEDGTNRAVVLDLGGRAVAQVRLIAIQRGDLPADPANWIPVGPDAPTDFESQDADAGVVVLPASIVGDAQSPNPATLDGGLSADRGDSIVWVTYILAAARFWWTRNDPDVTRFGWNGKTNRWEPYRGSPVKNLGVLSAEGEYNLVPKPTRFAVGDFLPRDPATTDSYALIRVGLRPDSLAVTPIVEVVPDGDVVDAYPFVGTTPDAVVGQTNGVLQFNPNLGGFIDQYAGQTIWYNPEQFPMGFSGDIGPMLGAENDPLFLSPVPGPTDRPFVRFGFRRHLSPTALDTDADLNAYTPSSGEVAWSKTSGRLKFNQGDLDRSDPTNTTTFDIQYLGERVYYDGVSLASRSLRTREPVQLVDDGGSPATVGSGNKLFIPTGKTLQDGSSGVWGLGVSGVLRVPDGTGTLPNLTAGTPETRPNGTGLVRQIEGVGDNIIFTASGAIEDLRVEEFEDDLPKLPFTIRKGRAYVARELVSGDPGSRVALGIKDRSRWNGEAIYFLQSDVQPAVYAEMARVYSRKRGPFITAGTEKLYFAIDGTIFTWDAATLGPSGSYTAAEVAASIDAILTVGRAYQVQDRVVIEAANSSTGSIEIGPGPTAALADRDFSGAALLGFAPGWRVDDPSNNECWLPDNGASLGVYRSPLNKDRSNDTPDIKARGQFSGTVIAESLPGTPTFTITTPPIQDVAGWDENVFFLVVDGLNWRLLDNLADIKYEFAQDRFLWLNRQFEVLRVERPTAALQFSHSGVVGDTMYPTVYAQNGLYVAADGNTWVYQEPGTDFLLPGNGSQGVALLIERIGDEVESGGAGAFAAGSTVFTDANAKFLTNQVKTGYRLRILAGDAQGSYIVAQDAISETTLVVSTEVPFPVDAGPTNGAPYATWRVYEGFTQDVYDPAVIADVQYTQFNPLPEEPFKIRLLDNIGTVPAPIPVTYLTAVLAEAYQKGRLVTVRFGLDYGSPEAALTPLVRGTTVGTMANGSLFLPDLLDPHFTAPSFSIRVGSKRYVIGTDLFVVVALTPDLPGDQIEVLSTTGEMNFGATTLDELEGSIVVYDQEFLPTTLLSAGTAEYDPSNGEISLSNADMTTYEGTAAYFVEQMISENQEDVAMSPLGGAFYFNRPLRSGQLVEAEYWQADSSGNRVGDLIVEFLPLILRLETASRTSSRVYAVNPTGRTIDGDVDTLIWVDSQLQNFGNTSTVAFQDGVLTFNADIDAAAVVQVNYAVYEAFGGEQAYNTSTIPVWRPPFFLVKSEDTVVLATDRTDDILPGMLLRLGANPFYIKSVTYDAGADQTTVVVWPPYEYETGSRAPGNDVLSLLSSEPVAPDVDGVTTTADLGFLLELTGVSYEPVDKGMLSFIFHGNLSQYAVAGHLIQMGGYPFIISGSELSTDGLTTRIDVTSPSPKGFREGTDAVKISVRPIYQPSPVTFLGIYPFVASEDVELVLYGEVDNQGDLLPGRTLTRDVHYKADPDTGGITLLSPAQGSLAPHQRLVFRYTKLRTLAPFVQDGAIIAPRYRAGYSFGRAPSAENGLLGTTLLAKYTYQNPDSFYFRTVPLTSYMGEVAQIAVSRVQASNPSGGAAISVFGAIDNKKQGRVGLLGERKDLTDQDRAARTFIDSYNVAIVAFEQVSETLNGAVIGDQDGKFRFFVGRGKVYAPPGYEDDITGDLNVRFVWSEVFLGANGSFGVSPIDKVVDPETATRDAQLVVDGDPMDPTLLRWYIDQQKALIANDMDDLVLVGLDRPNFLGGFPFPKFKMRGLFKKMWAAHRLSRLYPEAALAFTTTFPGIAADLAAGDAGVYAFFKVIVQPKSMRGEDENAVMTGSTFGKPIGVIANPSLGVIENITDANPRERLPRARIWAYYPEGSADLDAALGTTTVGIATVVATPLFLKDFPINPNTGFPDKTQFLSQGGDLADLNTGDYELSTPGFQAFIDEPWPKKNVKQQIGVGRPTGQTYTVGNANQTISKAFASSAGVDIDPYYGGVYVGTVQAGCVITLVDSKGKDLKGSDVLQVLEGELEGTPITVEQGDTIYAVPPASLDASEMDDPPTAEQMASFALGIPGYRRGFDLGVQKRGGNFIDLSMPSIKDPNFPVKEMIGQKGPDPLSAIEADLEFVNNSQYPHQFPALLGQPFNDNGDYTIPYRGTKNTELDRLGGLTVGFTDLLVDGPAPTATQLWLAVYPDEVKGVDGTVIAAWDGVNPPATLLTASDLTPVGAGPYVAHSGLGDVRPYDLLLVEVPNTVGTPVGVTGILTVGAVPTAGQVEVPRFVSATREGATRPNWYTFDNAMAHVSQTYTSGLIITSVPAAGPTRITTFDASSTGAPYFNDGQGGTVGGLNRILAGANNAIVIRLYQNGGGGSPGTLVEEIVITGSEASGGAAGGRPLVSFTASNDTLVVTTVGAANFVANLGTINDYTLTIDTYIDTTTDGLITALGGTSPGVGNGTGSGSCKVGTDRLTFYERVDLTTAPARGTTNAGAVVIEAGLSVHLVTSSVPQSTVNAPAEVNGGVPFTFLPRDGTGDVGFFTPAAYPAEQGYVKVMAWENSGNTSIPLSSLVFSAVPSSEIAELGVIANGTGIIPDSVYATPSVKTWLDTITLNGGAIGRIQPGDILTVTEEFLGNAAIKAGTYLVRHAVEEDGSAIGGREAAVVAQVGPSGQWLDGTLPKVTAIDEPNRKLTISTIGVGPGNHNSLWDAPSGSMRRLYVIPRATDPTTVVSMRYSGFTAGRVFTFVSGSGQDAAGGGITDAAFFAAVAEGMKVTGMRYLPMGTGWGNGLPSNNIVGWKNGTQTIAGFRDVILSNPTLTGDASANQAYFSYGGAPDIVSGAPGSASTNLGVHIGSSADSEVFQPDQNTIIYEDVAAYFDLEGIDSTQWDTVHAAGALTTTGIKAVLPSDRWVTSTTVDTAGSPTGTPGFVALAGIFLEPSFPRPVRPLNDSEPHVVYNGSSVTSWDRIAIRNAADFGGGTQEEVLFEVRRIRRFHDVNSTVTSNLAPLRFAYEIRRGVVFSYAPAIWPLGGFILTADTSVYGSATQLGAFNNADVNIYPGDVVRLLDANGNVVDTAEVGVVGESYLLLRDPGFAIVTPSPGDAFQVYLRQAPVPQEQNSEQLFEVVVDQVIHTTTPNYTAQTGGRVDIFNEMKDTTVPDFRALVVPPQAGDYVVIDAAGAVEGPTGPAVPQEYGSRPYGDQSVPVRGAPVWIAGRPAGLDDNRGFYRVESVATDGSYLTVSGVSSFSGDGITDAVFGSSGFEYAVLPTISASGVSDTGVNPSYPREAQQDLRATAPADPGTNSFDVSGVNDTKSIEPFGYRIVRPSTLFSEETVEFVFFLRERMLSWLEELTSSFGGAQSGSYFVFQRDAHIEDLGSPTNPNEGKGVVSNGYISDLGGLLTVSPFANVSDCLSVLDRRFWGLDFRLDTETPLGSATPYADLANGEGRPVLPDRVDDVLDRDDRLRELRYAWIKFRANVTLGTLPSITRYDEQLPGRQAEQEELLRLQEGLDET